MSRTESMIRGAFGPRALNALAMLVMLVGCGNVLSLDGFRVSANENDTPDAGKGCTTHAECQVGADPADPVICDKVSSRCVRLRSEDCQTVTGDPLNEQSVVIASMFSLSGAQAGVNRAREQSARLAVEEINAIGGVPVSATAAGFRPLVLLSCDEANLQRAAQHVVDELHIPAIIGPNTSQDTLDISNQITIAAGTLVITPTGVASSIADLLDDDLTWQMVPNDLQRAPLMIGEINRLEERLRKERNLTNVKLSIIYRDDALGEGTRVALNSLKVNGKGLADAGNLGTYVGITPYAPAGADAALIEATRKFEPDIVVLIGTAEAITKAMVPLEAAWTAPTRPEYVLIESSKTPELLDAVTGKPELRRRIRGTGALPAAGSIAVNESFIVSYTARHPGEAADLYGMAPTYDATYAVAFGIAALRGQPITGRSLAQALPTLATGGMDVELQSNKALSVFRMLAQGTPLTVIGTTAPLRWDDRGAVVGGTVELWCLSELAGKPVYESSGLSLDLMTNTQQGVYTQCP